MYVKPEVKQTVYVCPSIRFEENSKKKVLINLAFRIIRHILCLVTVPFLILKPEQ